MSELTGLQTHEHLKKSFVEESSTMQRYLYFAKIADFEGLPDTAKLFRKLAEGGHCNSHGSMDFLKLAGDPLTDLPIGETENNLNAAISSETYEYNELYPKMATDARADGFSDIASWFETLAKIKKSHVEQLKIILQKNNNPSKKVNQ